jgi:hypothetical protein
VVLYNIFPYFRVRSCIVWQVNMSLCSWEMLNGKSESSDSLRLVYHGID